MHKVKVEGKLGECHMQSKTMRVDG
jgi:hypothetical protein